MNKKSLDNFYIAIPNVFNDVIIKFDTKTYRFGLACLKCGEAIKQDIEARLKQEAKNSGSMSALCRFYAPTDFIDPKKKTHFDGNVFGHRNVDDHAGDFFSKTIWSTMKRKLCPVPAEYVEGTKIGKTGDCYGDEYMDCTKLLNQWIKDYGVSELKEIYKIEEYTVNSSAYCTAIIRLIQELFDRFFIPKIDEYVKSLQAPHKKSEYSLYRHQAFGIGYIYQLLIQACHNIIAQLPCRWGKTIGMLHIFNNSKRLKLMIVSCYVATVAGSYIKEKFKYAQFDNIQYIDIDNKEEVENFKYGGGKVMLIYKTTGTNDTNARRVSVINKIAKKMKIKSSEIMFVNEEADFGQHTVNTDKKFQFFVKTLDPKNEMTVLSITGTEAWKAEKLEAFGDVDGKITVNDNDWMQIIA